jgi:two-component system phosphate regulon response regulator OmpR
MPVSPSRPRILVVDDDPRLRKLLTRYLAGEAFEVDTASGAAEMDRRIERKRYDLLVLDVMMPGENGFVACKRLRDEGNDIPVIMLTAKGDDVDRIVGLQLGADDYMAKPFNPDELVARMRAVLRRRTPPPRGDVPAASSSSHLVRFGPFSLDLDDRTLARGGKPIPLTTGEFSMLKALALNLGKPMSREQLSELSRGREHEESARTVDVQVSRLRKLLGDDREEPRHIKTVWGVGYVLIPSRERD